MRLRTLIISSIALSASTFLAACSTTEDAATLQPKTLITDQQQVRDEELQFEVIDYMRRNQTPRNELQGVRVVAFNNRILLTGKVATQSYADKAVLLAEGVDGVSEIINEVVVGRNIPTHKIILSKNAESSSKSGFTSKVKSILDFNAKNKTAGSILSDDNITEVIKDALIRRIPNTNNYRFSVSQGIVYLIGVASNREELAKVIDIINDQQGVYGVVEYVDIV